MGLPNRQDLYLACLALAGLQAAVLVRFFLRALRRPAPAPTSWPSASVLIPCAGADPGLGSRAQALLGQGYGGEVRFVFILPSRRDPAWPILEALAAGSRRPAVLLASERTPAGRSGKIEDLLFALERPSGAGGPRPGADILVFADSDILAPPGWLEALVAALAEPGVGASTAAMLYLPSRLGPGPLLRLAWTAFGLPFFAWTGGVTGQSWAIRRADFDSLGARAVWARSLYEDLALTPLLRRWGKTVRFVAQAVPVTPDDSGLRAAATVFDNWIRAYRVYDPRTWALGLALTLLKAAALAAAALPPPRPGLALLVLGMDAAFLAASVAGLRLLFPGRFEPARALPGPLWLWAAASAPLLLAGLLLNYARSLSRDIRWGGRSYRIHGPQSIEVL